MGLREGEEKITPVSSWLARHANKPVQYLQRLDCHKSKLIGRYLVLISKVSIQLLCVFGLIVAELAFVRFQFIVLLYVLLQALVTGAGKGTLVTAEHDSLQVLGQLGTADFNRNDPFLCGDSTAFT